MVHKFVLGENRVSAPNPVHIEMTADIPNEQRYKEDISTIKNYQESGDIYQINYTKTFQSDDVTMVCN